MKKLCQTELWEILVPVYHPNRDRIHLEFHKKWDREVVKLAGGLTLFPTVKGAWGGLDDHCVYEEMIPVRIACEALQVVQIMTLTMEHYKQDSGMMYLISSRAVIMEYGDA